MVLKAHFCAVSAERRHFSKRGRIYCRTHFTNEFKKLPKGKQLGFIFQDMYARCLDQALRERPLEGLRGLTGTESASWRGDAYMVPVNFKEWI